MKKIKVTHLAQLASYRTATEILRTVITECDKMSWNEIKRCIESVAVDELSVRIKAHFSDNKNVQLIVGILPEHELSVYDLIGEEELKMILHDDNLHRLCFVWVVSDPDKLPETNPITCDMFVKLADADKNLLNMISMSVIIPNNNFTE